MIEKGGDFMFNLRWFYQFHVYFIVLGVLVLLVSLYIIKFKKQKPWRLKVHKRLSLTSVALIAIGVLLMFFGKASLSLKHFTVPHAYGGIIGSILLITTPILAYIGMKKRPKVLNLHRWFGRVTGVVVLFVSVFGVILLLSYI